MISNLFHTIRIGFWAVALGARVVAQAAAPVITNLTLAEGTVQFSVHSDLGITNQVQCCTDLGRPDWEVLTNLLVTESPYGFMDAVGLPALRRFYRVEALAGALPPPGMVLIPAGSFTMGNCMDPGEGWPSELPLHDAYVSAFYMDQHEVTKELWDEVKVWNGGNDYVYEHAGSGKAANHPVQMVNWRDCVKWCNARSQKEGLVPCYYNEAGFTTLYKSGTGTPYPKWSASGYRLPTEAEWEKAARGGVGGHRFPWGDTDNITHSRANFYSSSGDAYDKSPTAGYHPTFNDWVYPYTSPVGYFAANGYGVYDMAGNIWEWCWDWFSGTYYSSSPPINPHGEIAGFTRVLRGGSWYWDAFFCRTASRNDITPDDVYDFVGFRTVRAPGQ